MLPRARARDPKKGEGRGFDIVFIDTVEEGLRLVLGETATELVFLHLERSDGLRRGEIPSHIEEFSSGLAELMGPSGPFLERLLIKRLCSKLELEYDARPELRLIDHVKELRRRFEGRRA